MSGDGYRPPGRLRILADWLFDWFILPVMEKIFPCKHPDDSPPEKERQERR